MKIFRTLGKDGRTTIPFLIRVVYHIHDYDLVSYEANEDGSVTIRKEKICNDCTDNSKEDRLNLENLLDSLSEEEQKNAIMHLLAKKLYS